jgi:N-acetylmuramoyl-L-alanine amidase
MTRGRLLPSSLPLTAFLLTLLLAALLPPPCQAAFEWETVTLDDETYVSIDSIKTYYSFDSAVSSGSFIILKNPKIELRIRLGGPELYINRVKFVMSFSARSHKGKYWISRTDQSKLVDPVILPNHIRTAQRFHTVIIDPGHGGADTGSKGIYGNEKVYNLKLALKLKAELERLGIRVKMTRSTDAAYPTLQDRVAYANRIDGAIFVSIHFNWINSTRARGIETYALAPQGTATTNDGAKPGDDRSFTGNSRDAENIALATAVHSHCVRRTGAPDRGIKRDRFTVLCGIEKPAILLEGGFISNPTEGRLIASDAYLTKLAAATAEGIIAFRNALGS